LQSIARYYLHAKTKKKESCSSPIYLIIYRNADVARYILATAREATTACGVSRIENGTIKNPSPETLNKIARALGCSELEYRSAFAGTIGGAV